MREELGQIVDDPIDGGKCHPADPASPAKSRRAEDGGTALVFPSCAGSFLYSDRIPATARAKNPQAAESTRTRSRAAASRKARASYPAAAGARYPDGQAEKLCGICSALTRISPVSAEPGRAGPDRGDTPRLC